MTIIKEVEAGAIPTSANIVGTSYFCNARTLNKFGSEMQKPSLFYRINLFVNFIDLVWMYSIARGHFAILTIWIANKASVQAGNLVDKKEIIAALHRKLAAKARTSV